MLKGGNHVLEFTQPVLSHDLIADPTKSRCKDHRSNGNLQFLLCIIKTNSPGLTGHCAETAGIVIQLEAGFGINIIGGRHGLRIVNMRSMVDFHVFVEIVTDLLEAKQGALTATGADFFVNIAGLFFDRSHEVARLALQINQLGQGEDFDIRIAARLNQLGCEDAKGTVVGGKGLVQAGHDTADGPGFLNQIHLVAKFSQVKGGLDTGHAAAGHHDGSADLSGCFCNYGHKELLLTYRHTSPFP